MTFSVFPAGTVANTAAALPPLVSAEGAGYTNSRSEAIAGFTDTGLRFDPTSGDEFRCTAAGSYNINRGQWLDQGVGAQVWVVFNRTGGTRTNWDNGKISGTRYNIASTQTFELSQNIVGSRTIIGQFQFYDAASGGTLLDSGLAGQTWRATLTADPCPICCFTPDTLIEMARGIEVPIASIREGDEIATSKGPQVVKEIITRQNRRMYRITFSDGSYVNASEDHPLDVNGTPRSINPIIDYKHIGLPEKLQIGDVVTTRRGNLEIVSIESIEYPGTVYTLGNVLFYANGILVY